MNQKPDETIIDDLTPDEEVALALREAGIPVAGGVSLTEATRAYNLQGRAELRKAAKAVEKKLKGFYVDFLFEKLNLTRYG